MRSETMINTLNTWLVTLIALALSAAAAIASLVAADLISPVNVAPAGWPQDQLRRIDDLLGSERWVAVGSAGAAGFIGLLLLGIEAVRLVRREPLYGTDAKGYKVVLDRRTVDLLIREAAAQVSGLGNVRSSFRNTPDGLEVRCRATLAPSASIPGTALELGDRIRSHLQSLAGVEMSGIHLSLRHKLGRAQKREEPRRKPSAA